MFKREGAYVFAKEGTRVPFSKFRGFTVYSMNKTGGRVKMFKTRANATS